MKVVTVAQMRRAEAIARQKGISEAELQQRAGQCVAREAMALSPQGRHGPVVILCGPGNNGRDGMVAALLLAEMGYRVAVHLSPRHSVREDEIHRLRRLGGVAVAEDGAQSRSVLEAWLAEATVAVDGLLGVGVSGPMREPLAGVAAVLNQARRRRMGRLRVVSIDVPSGIDADTGHVPGIAVEADVTVVLGAMKTGLLRFPGAGLAGRLVEGDIGLAPEALESVDVETLSPAYVRGLLPGRPPDAHKRRLGRVLVVAGSASFVGAAYLTAAGAARVGAGLVTVAAIPTVLAAISNLLPEATHVVLPSPEPEEVAQAMGAVGEALADCRAVVVGPGLGREPYARDLVLGVLSRLRAAERPPALVVDADGLNILAAEAEWWRLLPPGSVLTPHSGEMARLAGIPSAEVDRDRWDIAQKCARLWGHFVVLKGAFTVVADPGGGAWVNPGANAALATGGTGDVLAGMISGLAAQGASPGDAAKAAVFLHFRAAQWVLERRGWATLLAGDLPAAIPWVLQEAAGRAQYQPGPPEG